MTTPSTGQDTPAAGFGVLQPVVVFKVELNGSGAILANEALLGAPNEEDSDFWTIEEEVP